MRRPYPALGCRARENIIIIVIIIIIIIITRTSKVASNTDSTLQDNAVTDNQNVGMVLIVALKLEMAS
jgi:hypothetical protein